MFDVLDHLIVNFEIWNKSPHINRIFKHYKVIVFETYSNYTLTPTFIPHIFPDFCRYFIEKEDITDEFIEIIAARSQKLVTENDIKVILQQLDYCNNYQFIFKMLSILPILFQSFPPNDKIVQILLSSHFSTDQNYSYIILPCFRDTKYFEQYLLFLMYHQNSYNLIQFFSQHKRFPGLISLSLILFSNADEQIQEKLSNTFFGLCKNKDIIPELIKNELWMLCPLIFASQTNEKNQMKIYYFLSQLIIQVLETQSKDEIGIKIIDKAMTILEMFNYSELNILLIKIIIEQLLIRKYKFNNQLLLLCFRAMFLKPSHYSNSMKKSFSNSPFPYDKEEEVSKVFSLGNILKVIQKSKTIKYTFQLSRPELISQNENTLLTLMRSLLPTLQNSQQFNDFILQCISYSIGEIKYPNMFSLKLNKFGLKEIIKPMIDDAQNKLSKVSIELENYIIKNEVKLINDIPNPQIPLMKYKKQNILNQKKIWKTISKHFMHQNTFWNLNVYLFKRSSIITGFSSSKLKRFLSFENQIPFNKVKVPKGKMYKVKCKRIKINEELDCIFIINNDKIEIYYQNRIQTISPLGVRNILLKKRSQITTAIEFISIDGRSILIDFLTPSNMVETISNLANLKFPSIKCFQKDTSYTKFFESQEIYQKYYQGKISNFNMILCLNTFSGRSYNDSNNYFIFPWSKPNQVLDKKAELSTTSNDLHYYLGRIPPFTFLSKQTEVLNSIDELYKKLEANEIKIHSFPEFYMFPEVFLSLNNNNNQNDLNVSDKYHSIYEFIYLNHKALEESNETIKWIEDNFGIVNDKSSRNSNLSQLIPLPIPLKNKNEISYTLKMYNVNESLKNGIFRYAKPNFAVIIDINDNIYKIIFNKNGFTKAQIDHIPKSCSNVLFPSSENIFVISKKSRKLYDISHNKKEIKTSIENTDFLIVDGSFVLSASKSGEVKIFLNKRLEDVYVEFSTLTDTLSTVTFSHHYSTVVCGTSNCRVLIYSDSQG